MVKNNVKTGYSVTSIHHNVSWGEPIQNDDKSLSCCLNKEITAI